MNTANDKYFTATALSNNGVAVPRFVLPSQVHSLEEVAHKLGWPCISKPRVGRGGREVIWHPEQDWPAVAALNDHYILQEFAAGGTMPQTFSWGGTARQWLSFWKKRN